MRPYRLYCPNLTIGTILLPGEEAHHAIAALRLGTNDPIELFDGNGRLAHARITYANRDVLRANVAEIHDRPGYDIPNRLTLGVVFPKTPRQGYLIEKCTELGVAAIWPLLSERAVAKPSLKAVDRWRRRAIEAAKQSNRYWVPTIAEPMALGDVARRAKSFSLTAYADPGSDHRGLSARLAAKAMPQGILVAIGPEGGWSERERAMFNDRGFRPIRLGPTILRTETAAIAVCAAVCCADRPDEPLTDSAASRS